jgi:hypothetical protein
VCLDTTTDETWEREVRALEASVRAVTDARPLLITLDSTPPGRRLAEPIEWRAASHWLLEADT